MESNDPDRLVQQFIDGDLADTELGPALHRIADDRKARELLRFELEMSQDLAARRPAPPSDFAERTAEALPGAADGAATETLGDRLRGLWRRLTTPVPVRLRPAAALLVVLAVGLVSWLAWPTATTTLRTDPGASPQSPTVQAEASSSGAGDTVWIRFLYTNSEADSVAVAGDFSQWTPVPLSPRPVNGETVWTGLVPVSRGEHEYQFVVDGQRWIADPLAPVTRSDGFGAENAVLNI